MEPVDESFLLEEEDQISLLPPTAADSSHRFVFSKEKSSKRKFEGNQESKKIEINLLEDEEIEDEKASKKRKIEIILIDDVEPIERKIVCNAIN